MKFKLLYIDWPWKFNARNNPDTRFGTGMHKYQGMSISDICKVNIQDICDENCAIAFWVTGAKLAEAFIWQRHMEQFGFRYATKLFTWLKVAKDGKPRSLPGTYTLSATEDVLLLVRGSMPVVKKGEKQILLDELDIEHEAFTEVCLKPHSRKPLIIRERLETIFGDVPRVELFSRQEKKYDDFSWHNVGNEVAETPGLDVNQAIELIKDDKYV